jgi:hypothetical protein
VPPEGGESNEATVTITFTLPPPELVHSFNMDSDPGWSTEGEWAYGVPTGGGAYNQDPTSGYTGDNVYGYDLNGNYDPYIPTYYLTTTAIDCSGLVETELRFWRWLGIEHGAFDKAGIEVSNNGTDWTTVWSHTGTSIQDTSWTQVAYDIQGVADDQSTVYVRWSIGPTDGSGNYPGWNIDDVEFWAVQTQAPTCEAQDAASCRDHAAAGRLCLDMGVSGGVDPRSGGITELEIDLLDAGGFAGGVTVDCANAGDVSGNVSGSSVNGNTVTVTFDPSLPDQDACTVTLDCGASVCVRGCEGDLNRSGDTSTSDALQAKVRFGQAADASNCEWDFNLSGDITSADALAIKIRFGFSAPACP